MSLLADCFIKLMTDNILPNARSVKGKQNLTLLYLHLNILNNVRSLCSCLLWHKKQVYVQDSRIHYKYTEMQTLLYDTLINKPGGDEIIINCFLIQVSCLSSQTTLRLQ